MREVTARILLFTGDRRCGLIYLINDTLLRLCSAGGGSGNGAAMALAVSVAVDTEEINRLKGEISTKATQHALEMKKMKAQQTLLCRKVKELEEAMSEL